MSTINPDLERRLNLWLDFVHHRLGWITETEARAAWFGSYGSKGEFDAERTTRILQSELILDRLIAIGGGVVFQRV